MQSLASPFSHLLGCIGEGAKRLQRTAAAAWLKAFEKAREDGGRSSIVHQNGRRRKSPANQTNSPKPAPNVLSADCGW
jgi:hypothetical protein